MGNTTAQWRAAIGSFLPNRKGNTRSQNGTTGKRSQSKPIFLLIAVASVICALLMESGNVEKNPGPNDTTSSVVIIK